MALGYENTGTGPNIIANAGNAMAADIRRVGEQIRKDILDHKTDKQVAGLLSEAQTISPDSPTFQQDLVGVLARYPLAASDPRAQVGLKMLGAGWQQEQRKKELTQRFDNQKDLAKIRAGGGGIYDPEGGSADNFNVDPLGRVPAAVQPTGSALGSPEGGFSFGAGLRKSPLGVAFTPPSDDSEGTALTGIQGPTPEEQLARFDKMNAGKALSRSAMNERTRLSGALIRTDSQRRTAPKNESIQLFQDDQGNEYEWGTKSGWQGEVPPKGTTVFKPGAPQQQWRSGASNIVNVKTGEVIEALPTKAQQGNLNLREEKGRFDALKLQVGELQKQRDQLDGARKMAEAAGDAALALSRWNEMQILSDTIKDVTKGLTKEQKSELGADENELVPVVAPNGKMGKVPRSNLDNALKQGYTLP